MAEYEGLLAGLRAAAGLGVRRLLVQGDSQLVVNQGSKEYQCAYPQMAAYVAEVRRMERHFDELELRHIPRKTNTEADKLSRLASSRAPLPLGSPKKSYAIQPSRLPTMPKGEARHRTGGPKPCHQLKPTTWRRHVLRSGCGWMTSATT